MVKQNRFADKCCDCGADVPAFAGRLYQYSGCNIPTAPMRDGSGRHRRVWKPKRGQNFVNKVRCEGCVRLRGDEMPGAAAAGITHYREGYTPGYSEACGVWD